MAAWAGWVSIAAIVKSERWTLQFGHLAGSVRTALEPANWPYSTTVVSAPLRSSAFTLPSESQIM